MPNSKAFNSDRLQRMSANLRHHVDSGEVPALVSLISRRVETQSEAYGDPNNPVKRDSIFRIASLTKLVTAAAAMILTEECKLRLDDPVDDFLPELANQKVLTHEGAQLSETVPANRSITTRDLLTLRMGIGHIMRPGEFPIMKAAQQRGLLTGPPQPKSLPNTDEWIKRVGELPLIHHPGEQWMYDLGIDVLGVLIARASGQTLEKFLKDRIFDPLGMKDTGFHVPKEKLDRFTTCFRFDQANKQIVAYDDRSDSQWAMPPKFASGAGGLVSTVDDFGAFCQMLLNKGTHKGQPILSRASIELMTSPQIMEEQAAANPIFFGRDRSWGFGVGIVTRRTDYPSVGTYGWTGGLGSIALIDPQEDMFLILLTERMMDSPKLPAVFSDFIASTYQAISD